MFLPRYLKYSKRHTWVKAEDGLGRVGLSDYAQEMLQEVLFVHLPEPGTEVKYLEPFGSIESIKAVQKLCSPVTGTVEKVNEDLEFDPGLVNNSPYDKGWMILVRLQDESEIDTHMSAEEYKEWIKEHPD
nr:glycine cleavage system protein GcvH [Desulfobacterales bacterium]